MRCTMYSPCEERGRMIGSGEPGVKISSFSLARPTVGISMWRDRKSTRLNSSHQIISYAVFCLKKKKHANRFKTGLREPTSGPRLTLGHCQPGDPVHPGVRRAYVSHVARGSLSAPLQRIEQRDR